MADARDLSELIAHVGEVVDALERQAAAEREAEPRDALPDPAGAAAISASLAWEVEQQAGQVAATDARLAVLAALAGLAVAIGGGLGGLLLATQRFADGFQIAIGGCLSVAVVALLAALATALRGLGRARHGAGERSDGEERVSDRLFAAPVHEVARTIAMDRRAVLLGARDRDREKARAADRASAWAGAGVLLLVAALVTTAVGSVVG